MATLPRKGWPSYRRRLRLLGTLLHAARPPSAFPHTPHPPSAFLHSARPPGARSLAARSPPTREAAEKANAKG